MSELERTLTELGRELAVPAAPDLVTAVLVRIERREVERSRPRRWALALAILVITALAATLAIPDARSAFFRVLHIGGEQIELVAELPPVAPQPAEIDLDLALGTRATLEQARREAGFDLHELDTEPDRVYLGGRDTVWFLYGTPQNVRLLIAQTPRVTIDEPFILKKLVASGTPVEELSIGGVRGFYLGGKAPHLVLLLDESGDAVEETARLARNVLVWEANGVAYRLEGQFSRDEALTLASSLR